MYAFIHPTDRVLVGIHTPPKSNLSYPVSTHVLNHTTSINRERNLVHISVSMYILNLDFSFNN
jgi:hypothetical protein